MSGSLDSDKFLKALLQLRNTPDPDCRISPAEIIFGRPIRDAFSFINRLEKYSNEAIQPTWREAWAAKESALRTRFFKTSEKLNQHAQKLEKLSIGDRCLVQNQTGNNPKRWDRTGVIMDIGQHDQYSIKIDGSGRVTTRNRQYIRKFQPASMDIKPAPQPLKLYEKEEIFPGPQTQGNCQSKNDGFEIDKGMMNGQRQSQEHELGAPNMESPEEPSNTTPISTQTTPLNPLIREKESIKQKKVPIAIKRLMTHNNVGLKEGIKPIEEGGRLTRNSKKNNRE